MIAGGLLTVVEVAVALLCACLPVYRPLVKRFAPGLTTAAVPSDYKSRSTCPGGVKNHASTTSNKRGSRRRINITNDISMTAHTYVNGERVLFADDDELSLFPKDTRSISTAENAL